MSWAKKNASSTLLPASKAEVTQTGASRSYGGKRGKRLVFVSHAAHRLPTDEKALFLFLSIQQLPCVDLKVLKLQGVEERKKRK